VVARATKWRDAQPTKPLKLRYPSKFITEQELLATDPKLIVLAPLSTQTKKTTLFKKSQAWKNQIAQ